MWGTCRLCMRSKPPITIIPDQGIKHSRAGFGCLIKWTPLQNHHFRVINSFYIELFKLSAENPCIQSHNCRKPTYHNDSPPPAIPSSPSCHEIWYTEIMKTKYHVVHYDLVYDLVKTSKTNDIPISLNCTSCSVLMRQERRTQQTMLHLLNISMLPSWPSCQANISVQLKALLFSASQSR